jgi:NitT/TauT family transport system ATP-binding protein
MTSEDTMRRVPVEVSNLSFAYPNGVAVFDGFNLRIEGGESLAVIGPPGCGKSTLLYLIAGLRRPSRGKVLVAGVPVIGPRRETGLILQDYGLLPWATALGNIALGLRLRGVSSRERKQIATEWLLRLGLERVAHRYPGQMSGGQRQRVAVARTLATNPDLLLMDEPFSALDSLTREDLQGLVLGLGIATRLTTVLVTHSVEEAALLGRRVLVLGKPPLQSGVLIPSPGAGSPEYRHSKEFLDVCHEVRERVHEAARAFGEDAR